ncbi:MAG: hypothetical protein AAGF10_06415 [Verrucomicrobiota bacterium]
MNSDDTNDQQLDALLSGQTVSPRERFTERTLARIREDADKPAAGLDQELDALLEAQPLEPQLTESVLQAAKHPEEAPSGRILGLPSWVATVGGMAAAVAIGAMAFIALFQYAYQQNELAENAPPADETPLAAETDELTLEDLLLADSEASGPHTVDLLILQDALLEIDILSDPDTVDALSELVNL